MVPPRGRPQLALPALQRDGGTVALQPDEAAQRPAREQDETHHTDGAELGLADAVLFLDGRRLRRHLPLDPLLHLPLDPRFLGGPGRALVILTGDEQEHRNEEHDGPLHDITSFQVKPGREARPCTRS